MMVKTSARAVQKFVTGRKNLERDALHAEIAGRYKDSPVLMKNYYLKYFLGRTPVRIDYPQ